MDARQKLIDLANDGINRLDEDDAHELLAICDRTDNAWIEIVEPRKKGNKWDVLLATGDGATSVGHGEPGFLKIWARMWFTELLGLEVRWVYRNGEPSND